MNPLLKKEIRLLLPSWSAILALEVLAPWFVKDSDLVFVYMPVVFFFGTIILVIDSFGREFSPGIFTMLMSQPVERRQIWRIKMTVLFLAAALIFAVYFITCEARLHQAVANLTSIWHVNPKIIGSDFRNAMIASVAVMLVALSGGLWTTLLLRQIAAAFWITLLTPIGLLFLIVFVMSKFFNSASDVVVFSVLYSVAGLYTVSGFWLAHRMFHRAQDAAWMGGVINFSAWRYFESGNQAVISVRRRRPVAALLKKEFQLHSVSLVCVGAVLALHIGALILRAIYANLHKDSLVYGLTTIFWIFWLVIPLIIGCTAVAEERKLGMADAQFCLPASRRRQFAVKFIPIMIIGTLLGGVMPLLVEGIAGLLGAPNEIFSGLADFYNRYNDFGRGLPVVQITIIALAAGVAWVAFFASTLAKNFLQALGTAIVIVTACCLFVSLNGFSSVVDITVFGITLWRSVLPILIAFLAIPVALLWLAWLNFSHYREGWRLWRRNLLGIVGALVFIAASSGAIYNRVWEVFEPVELPHGPPIFSTARPPTLSNDGYISLKVRLPDGRFWFDSLGYPFIEYRPNIWQELWWSLFRPLPVSIGPQQFMAGSNWVSATTEFLDFGIPLGGGTKQVTGYLDTVGVQADGTLWISSEAKPFLWTGNKMVQVGDETNWQQVIRLHPGLLLLKRDGTLWQWGTNHLDWNWGTWQTNWPTIRVFKPQQIGTNSDWQEIFSQRNDHFAQEKNGKIWSINWNWEMGRKTDLDQIVPQTFSGEAGYLSAYVGKDGTLWVCDRYFDQNKGWKGTGRFLQAGKGTNWVAVTMNWGRMVALKSDGSLWQWNLNPNEEPITESAKRPPMQLGIHDDWVGLTIVWGDAVSLAADGSLWLWPGINDYAHPLVRPPKQPEFLGNIFGKPD